MMYDILSYVCYNWTGKPLRLYAHPSPRNSCLEGLVCSRYIQSLRRLGLCPGFLLFYNPLGLISAAPVCMGVGPSIIVWLDHVRAHTWRQWPLPSCSSHQLSVASLQEVGGPFVLECWVARLAQVWHSTQQLWHHEYNESCHIRKILFHCGCGPLSQPLALTVSPLRLQRLSLNSMGWGVT